MSGMIQTLLDLKTPPIAITFCDQPRADVRQLMLLAEAAQGAGIGSRGPTMGRPTCSVLPEAIEGARSASSFGCAGNRVYTGAADHEGYFAVPGAQLAALESRLATVV